MYFPWYFKCPCLHPLPQDEQMAGSEVLKRCRGMGNCGEQLGTSPTHPHNPNSRGRSRSESGSAAASTRDAGGGDADAAHEITAGLRAHKPTHPAPCPSPKAAPRHHTTGAGGQCITDPATCAWSQPHSRHQPAPRALLSLPCVLLARLRGVAMSQVANPPQ